jgi:hypothetical protein
LPKVKGKGSGELMFSGYRVSVFQDKKFWTSVSQLCEYLNLLDLDLYTRKCMIKYVWNLLQNNQKIVQRSK